MKTTFHIWCAAALGFATAGCSPTDRTGLDGLGQLDDGGMGADGGGRGDDGLDAEPLAFGVISGDYTVVSVGLLGPDGSVLADEFIHSGSASAGLVTALSGDVHLPTRSGDPGVLTLLDRYRTDVITRVDPAGGTVLGQVKTHAPVAGEAAFSSNPQDFVYIDPTTAWVTRGGVHDTVAADHPDRGNDLLRIDPTGFTRGERIGLDGLNAKATREDPDTGASETLTAYARPSAMVRLRGDLVVVGLTRLSLSFDAVGPGAVALVDLDAATAEAVPLPGLENCASVRPIPGDPRRAVVACTGFYRAVQRDTAGLAILHLRDDGTLEVEHLLRAADAPESAVAVDAVVALGATEVLAVEAGAQEITDDRGEVLTPSGVDTAYVVDVATGAQTRLFEAAGRYVLGSGAYNPGSGLLLVPDASVDADGMPSAGVRRFARDGEGEFTAGETIRLHRVLPARQVRPL